MINSLPKGTIPYFIIIGQKGQNQKGPILCKTVTKFLPPNKPKTKDLEITSQKRNSAPRTLALEFFFPLPFLRMGDIENVLFKVKKN